MADRHNKEGKDRSTWGECRPRERAFIEAFLGSADGSWVKAAEIAGFKAASTRGARIYRRLRQVIEDKLVSREADAIITTRGVLTRLSTLADDPQVRAADRLKALELLARIHGMLSDRLDISVSRKDLRGMIGEVKNLPIDIEARPVAGEPDDHGATAITWSRASG